MVLNGARLRRLRFLIVPLIALAWGLAPPAPAAAAVPTGNAFYVPPDSLPDGRPGDVIRALRIGGIPGARAYKILYLSRDARNRPIAVSGMVMVPTTGDPATMPIVGVAVGTVGLGDGCAPSKSPLSILTQAAGALQRGWAIAATDYEGMGTPGRHTYVVGRSEGHAVLDAVRAAQRLDVAGLSNRAKVGLWGYSQGGGAVTWAGELQPAYAPELDLVGISAGGVPADLEAVAAPLDGLPTFGLLPMAAAGFDAAYPELDLERFLTPLGKRLMAEIQTQCLADIMLGMLGRTIAQLSMSNPLEDPAWVKRFRQNKLGAHPPRVPIHLYHARPYDEAVALGQARTLMRTYCDAGADVTWQTYLGDHAIAGAAGQHDARQFLADRFAGKPTSPTC